MLASSPGSPLLACTIERMTIENHGKINLALPIFNEGSKVIGSITHARRGEPGDEGGGNTHNLLLLLCLNKHRLI